MKKRKMRHFLIALTLLAICILSAYYLMYCQDIKREVVVEVGSERLNIEDFVKDKADAAYASFITSQVGLPLSDVGSFNIIVECKGRRYTTKVIVTDTVAPVATPVTVTCNMREYVPPLSLVKDIIDNTGVFISYESEPDMTVSGEHIVTLLMEDECGNIGRVQSSIIVLADEIAPVITGVSDIIVYENENISYRRNVEAIDDIEGKIAVEIDASGVNLNKAGTYKVIYKAKDSSGNMTEVEAEVLVKHQFSTALTDEEIESIKNKGNEILSQIITDGMSVRQQLQAIFDYVYGSITYTGGASGTDYMAAARQGLDEHYGECYVYFSTSKLLLDLLGIDNMDVIGTGNRHYWNMVKYEGEWYHFDTTKWSDDNKMFLWTDSQIDEYSDSHDGSHTRDKSLYPVTP